MRTLAVTSAMTYAVRRTEVRRTKVRGRKFVDGSSTDESSWTEVRRKLDGSMWMKVQRMKVRRRTSDESWAEVRWTSDESPTYVERVELSRCCGNSGRRCYTAVPHNVTTMAENTIARNVVATLASNVLQLAAFLQRYCSNALDLAALLRRPATRCYYDNALDLATLLRWSATRWTSQRCCDGRQRATTPANATLQRFCFFLFLHPTT